MKGLFNKLLLSLGVFVALGVIYAHAQTQGFIYGTVITEDGDKYTGPIRWGKEEVYWSDMFNASKRENENLDYLSDDDLDDLRDRRGDNGFVTRFVSVSWDWDDANGFVHEFSTAFGNIKSIEVRSSERIMLELKNGEVLKLGGSGYNDVGARIQIIDEEIGLVKVSWSNLEAVKFSPAPSNLEETFGNPLYGTVQTDIGEFTGYVQWDHDERLGSDKLDGDTRDDDVSIPFDKIRSIERDGYSRSQVTLKSGRELELRGSNDVNDENRGIIINVNGLGRVDVEWEDFDKVTFKDAPDNVADYDSFKAPKELRGTVETEDGDSLEGYITYDLDEEYDIEVLNGQVDDTKFIIPFKYIRSIKPIGYDECRITLKNGEKLLLEDTQDVGDDHSGILINKRKENTYVEWRDVDRVTFQ